MNEKANAGAAGGIDEGDALSRKITEAIANSPLVAELKEKLAAAEAKAALLEVTVASTQLADQHTKPGVANESHASSKERFGIMLDPARDKNEIDPVFVSVNGRAYQLKRGKYIEVPREVIEVLNHAVQTITVTRFDDRTGIALDAEQHNARRFPFRMLGKAVDVNGKRLLKEGGPDLSDSMQ